MKIKLAVTDLDGTLLNQNGEVPPENIAAFQALRRQGVLPVVATGRIDSAALPFAKQIGADEVMICTNGAVIMDLKRDKMLFSAPISTEDSLAILKVIKQRDLYFRVHIGSQSYGERFSPRDIQHKIRETILVPDLAAFIVQNHLSILKFFIIFDDLQARLECWELLSKIAGVELTSSWEDNIEINRRGVNKGFGLKMLCEYLKISPAEVIAFGDNGNDMQMLFAAGIGVAMGNAALPVKQIADFVTLGHENGGIPYAIQTLLDEHAEVKIQNKRREG